MGMSWVCASDTRARTTRPPSRPQTHAVFCAEQWFFEDLPRLMCSQTAQNLRRNLGTPQVFLDSSVQSAPLTPRVL